MTDDIRNNNGRMLNAAYDPSDPNDRDYYWRNDHAVSHYFAALWNLLEVGFIPVLRDGKATVRYGLKGEPSPLAIRVMKHNLVGAVDAMSRPWNAESVVYLCAMCRGYDGEEACSHFDRQMDKLTAFGGAPETRQTELLAMASTFIAFKDSRTPWRPWDFAPDATNGTPESCPRKFVDRADAEDAIWAVLSSAREPLSVSDISRLTKLGIVAVYAHLCRMLKAGRIQALRCVTPSMPYSAGGLTASQKVRYKQPLSFCTQQAARKILSESGIVSLVKTEEAIMLTEQPGFHFIETPTAAMARVVTAAARLCGWDSQSANSAAVARAPKPEADAAPRATALTDTPETAALKDKLLELIEPSGDREWHTYELANQVGTEVMELYKPLNAMVSAGLIGRSPAGLWVGKAGEASIKERYKRL